MDVTIRANTKLKAGIWFVATNGKSITNINVTNLRALNSVATGVLFELNGGVAIEPNPVLQGCDFERRNECVVCSWNPVAKKRRKKCYLFSPLLRVTGG